VNREKVIRKISKYMNFTKRKKELTKTVKKREKRRIEKKKVNPLSGQKGRITPGTPDFMKS